jgi:MFS family permease
MVANRDLRLLVLGQFISAVGDHFYLIAMPWLGLQITGSALVAGSLLAVASLPRSVFMLLGGALSDRYSSKTLLILSNGLQGVLMIVLGSSLILSPVQLWFVYVLVFLTGFIDAFGLPAFNALLPRIVEAEELESGNIYLQGANIVSGVIGPALAGLLISMSPAQAGSQQPALSGLGVVFLINALTFFAGISIFWGIRTGDAPKPKKDSSESLITSIGSIIEYVRSDPQLRNLLGLMMSLGLLLAGTLRVGFALMAETQFSGARDFGTMTSAFGAGMLAGMAGVKLLPRPPQKLSGIIVLALFACVPAGVISLGFAPPLVAGLAIIGVMGAAFGYVNIYLLSWLQRRTPSHLLGRIIAMVLFSTIGLAPVSQILMGYLLDLNLQATMTGVGSLVLILLVVTGANRKMWNLEEEVPEMIDYLSR